MFYYFKLMFRIFYKNEYILIHSYLFNEYILIFMNMNILYITQRYIDVVMCH